MTRKTNPNTKTTRPPIISVMGHVDHGKSTLLDYIRRTEVAANEAGGITQHISAYVVKHKTKDGQEHQATFLDTPGHKAFSAMRGRGAELADITVLIISAEDSIKPQTKEAMTAIKNAGVPFVVAINKIDRPESRPEQVKQDLTKESTLVESYGGEIPDVNISAVTGEGIQELLDTLFLLAEMEELTADPDQLATGEVLEVKVDNKAGTLVTLIIKDGTLKTGQCIVSDGKIAKIKKMENFLGDDIKEAGPASPVLVFGFSESPQAGSDFQVFSSKKEAEKCCKEHQPSNTATPTPQPPETASGTDQETTEVKEVPVIIKADTVGTLEAIKQEIGKLNVDRIKTKIIHTGVGNISSNDINIAVATQNSIIIGFNTGINKDAQECADRFNIPIFTSQIIYELTEKLEEKLIEIRPTVTEDLDLGHAKILKVFSKTKSKQIIGGEVKSGKAIKNKPVKIIRRDAEIGQGKITELQSQKVSAQEVEAEQQFGAKIETKTTIAPGDDLEIFEKVTKK